MPWKHRIAQSLVQTQSLVQKCAKSQKSVRFGCKNSVFAVLVAFLQQKGRKVGLEWPRTTVAPILKWIFQTALEFSIFEMDLS
jgi:hypothetical protein